MASRRRDVPISGYGRPKNLQTRAINKIPDFTKGYFMFAITSMFTALRQRALRIGLILIAAMGFAVPAWATNYPVGCGSTASSDLANAISTAAAGGGNSVTLTSGCTYTMIWDREYGRGRWQPDGFHHHRHSDLVINGNGATIALSGTSAPARFFYIGTSGAFELERRHAPRRHQ